MEGHETVRSLTERIHALYAERARIHEEQMRVIAEMTATLRRLNEKAVQVNG